MVTTEKKSFKIQDNPGLSRTFSHFFQDKLLNNSRTFQDKKCRKRKKPGHSRIYWCYITKLLQLERYGKKSSYLGNIGQVVLNIIHAYKRRVVWADWHPLCNQISNEINEIASLLFLSSYTGFIADWFADSRYFCYLI